MEKQPPGSPEDEIQRLIAEAQERVQPFYDYMAAGGKGPSPIRVAIQHYFAEKHAEAESGKGNSSDTEEEPLPESEDKV